MVFETIYKSAYVGMLSLAVTLNDLFYIVDIIVIIKT